MILVKNSIKANAIFVCMTIVLLSVSLSSPAQNGKEIAFIADMQKPLRIEKLLFKTEQNERATDSLCAYILKRKPSALFFVGDMVACGSRTKSWKKVDLLLNSLKSMQISFHAVPGNHEYMFNAKKGKKNFDLRFGGNNNIIVQNIDSVAVVMLNSNFGKLKGNETSEMLLRYAEIVDSLQLAVEVKHIVIAVHHSPFTCSKTVKPSKEVETMIVPKYLETKKAVLFLSGHAHLLEMFNRSGKYFCVIGGGDGIKQKQRTVNEAQFSDLLKFKSFRFFYCTLRRDKDFLYLNIHGVDKHRKEHTEELLKLKII